MLTQIFRLSLATGCMDAVTFTSDVFNTLINRFVLKGLPYFGMGRISYGGSSGPVEGSGAAKPGPEAFLDLWLGCPYVSSRVSLFSTES